MPVPVLCTCVTIMNPKTIQTLLGFNSLHYSDLPEAECLLIASVASEHASVRGLHSCSSLSKVQIQSTIHPTVFMNIKMNRENHNI